MVLRVHGCQHCPLFCGHGYFKSHDPLKLNLTVTGCYLKAVSRDGSDTAPIKDVGVSAAHTGTRSGNEGPRVGSRHSTPPSPEDALLLMSPLFPEGAARAGLDRAVMCRRLTAQGAQ